MGSLHTAQPGRYQHREAVVLFAPIIFSLYALGAVIITVYTLGELHLLYYYYQRHRQAGTPSPKPLDAANLPLVTVQVAMYNELYVAEHIIDACSQLDYPHDRLEIQVCDDSTDESYDVAQRRIEHWRAQGVNIRHLHRKDRSGYKAGALAAATKVASGEFVAIFDADFRPPQDFLRRTLPYFRDRHVGIVQSRWGHLNRTYSVLTYVQAVLLDMFFIIEHKGRAVLGAFLRFNGSGGVWRKKCLDDSGGWSADTLCEDLDLCYRAQLRGWTAVYDDTIVSPAEVPVTMSDFKAQQYRWVKGKAQVIRKLLPAIWAARLPPAVKIHALFDLLNIFAGSSVLVLGLCSVPLTYIAWKQPEYYRYMAYVSFGLSNLIIAPWFALIVLKTYYTGGARVTKEFFTVFPPLVATVVGMPLFQTAAMVDGFFGGAGSFHKTAKYNITQLTDRWRDKLYSPKRISGTTLAEGVLAVFFMYGTWLSVTLHNWGALPFQVALVFGYSYIFLRSVLKA
ncbi:MAG: glycosyltransferase [Gemmatimonadetes bacterium]|nr:glycosyltransferase [Gemmatimonadota bacterium]